MSIGLDFGTSNSAVAKYNPSEGLVIAEIEGTKKTMPSAVFYELPALSKTFGRAAINNYIDHAKRGRLLTGFKSLLDDSIVGDATQIGMQRVKFISVIKSYIQNLKHTSEKFYNHNSEEVVLGRPVRFNDDSDSLDKEAEQKLKNIAQEIGFKTIEFQYEPIAAALDHERTISTEEICLIVDVGGGTTDFSILRLSPNPRKNYQERKNDILANSGIHIAGTDFDADFSRRKVMPYLGSNSTLKPKGLPAYGIPFNELSDWYRIPDFYSRKTGELIREMVSKSSEPDKIEKLLKIYDERLGHRLALETEKAKISLSENASTNIHLTTIFTGADVTLLQKDLEESIEGEIESIVKALGNTIKESGLKPTEIDTVFFTGGSTSISFLRDRLKALVPNAKEVSHDRLTSVVSGLALDAHYKFS